MFSSTLLACCCLVGGVVSASPLRDGFASFEYMKWETHDTRFIHLNGLYLRQGTHKNLKCASLGIAVFEQSGGAHFLFEATDPATGASRVYISRNPCDTASFAVRSRPAADTWETRFTTLSSETRLCKPSADLSCAESKEEQAIVRKGRRSLLAEDVMVDTPCDSLEIVGLPQVFYAPQDSPTFWALNATRFNSGNRRIWTNNQGLIVYFTFRWDDQGEWVISNNSYTMIGNRTGGPYTDVPAPGGAGTSLWDHFSNNDPYAPLLREITLYLECYATAYPTTSPTPGTLSPSVAPTSPCKAIEVTSSGDRTCDVTIVNLFTGEYNLGPGTINSRAWYPGTGKEHGWSMFFSPFWEAWVIDSDDNEYGAISEDKSATDLPQDGLYDVYKTSNLLIPNCYATFFFTCRGDFYPSLDPTPSPTTLAPTARRPTGHPSRQPSTTPSGYPTVAPSGAPTDSPTSAPVSPCDGLTVNGTGDALDGRYQRAFGESIAGRNVWYSLNSDGRIFWSDSKIHETWAINSNSLGRYWLSQRVPDLLPPAKGLWDLYLGASPFLEESRQVRIYCQADWFPTRSPTDPPSNSPSDGPTDSPSQSPTDSPTDSPSDSPTDSPTQEPTKSPSDSPTLYPSDSPSETPTSAPTRENCSYMIVGDIGAHVGIYESAGLDGTRGAWVQSGGPYNISFAAPYWWLDNFDGDESTTYVVDFDDWRPPQLANWSNLNMTSLTIIEPGIEIEMDCSPTLPPTDHPSVTPTFMPTLGPTSPCLGLEFTYVSVAAEFENPRLENTYILQHYLLNGHRWWKSAGDDYSAKISFVDGHWRAEPAEGVGTLIYEGGDAMFPPSGLWTLEEHETEQANVLIHCTDTSYPTRNPTFSPSRNPTEDHEPAWNCPDMPYFWLMHGSDENASVYWDIPTLQDPDDPDVAITNAEYTPGQYLAPGEKYTLVYTAQEQEHVAVCEVVLYVVENTTYSTHDYCVHEAFSVQFYMTEQYLAIDTEKLEFTISEDITGLAHVPDLDENDQRCFVSATVIVETGTAKKKKKEDDESKFLGFKADNFIWDVLIAVVVFCVVALALESCRRIYRDRKLEADKQEQAALLQDVGPTQEEMAGVASSDQMRKATLTSASPGLSPRDGPGSTGFTGSSPPMMGSALALGPDAQGGLEMQPLSPGSAPGSSPPAGLPGVAGMASNVVEVKEEEEEPPNDPEYWRAQLDLLHANGYRNQPKNIELLIKYCVRDASGRVDRERTGVKVDGVLREIFERKRRKKEAEMANRPGPTPPPLAGSALRIMHEEAQGSAMRMMEEDWQSAGNPGGPGGPGGPPPPPGLGAPPTF